MHTPLVATTVRESVRIATRAETVAQTANGTGTEAHLAVTLGETMMIDTADEREIRTMTVAEVVGTTGAMTASLGKRLVEAPLLHPRSASRHQT